MLEIRKAALKDLGGITAIYNEAIVKTTATFDTTPKTEGEQLLWFQKHGDEYPLLVAVDAAQTNSEVLGWASLSPWSDRCAYSETGEVSIYIRESEQGKGLGKKLFEQLIAEAKMAGFHTLVSRIAGESLISIKLHENFGFTHVGTLKEVGRKFGKLLDVHMMQKMLMPD
jgi:phosphinothricin acetyltransferase